MMMMNEHMEYLRHVGLVLSVEVALNIVLGASGCNLACSYLHVATELNSSPFLVLEQQATSFLGK